jgi:hypothetical protein
VHAIRVLARSVDRAKGPRRRRRRDRLREVLGVAKE